jgi:hypothetical protein
MIATLAKSKNSHKSHWGPGEHDSNEHIDQQQHLGGLFQKPPGDKQDGMNGEDLHHLEIIANDQLTD